MCTLVWQQLGHWDFLSLNSALESPVKRIVKWCHSSARGSSLSAEEFVVLRSWISLWAQQLLGSGTVMWKTLCTPLLQQGNGDTGDLKNGIRWHIYVTWRHSLYYSLHDLKVPTDTATSWWSSEYWYIW